MVDYPLLQKIGVSKTAVACYASLDKDGTASVTQLAERLNKPRTGLYRVLQRLEQQGFVTGVKTSAQPVYFHPRPLNQALEHYARYQHQIVQPLLEVPQFTG